MIDNKKTIDSLNHLAWIALKIANNVDRNGEAGIAYIEDLGLGYRALSSYLRDGVKAITDIQEMYSTAIVCKSLAEIAKKEADDFLIEIFGDSEAPCFNDDYKKQIKEFIEKLDAGLEI